MAVADPTAFETYFKAADLDRDGRISGPEAVAFLKGSNLPQHVLAQIWTHANKNQTSYLDREEFYNALRLVTVAQSGRQLTPDIVKSALYGPAATKIPAPRVNISAPVAQAKSAAVPPIPPASPAPATSSAGAPQTMNQFSGSSLPQNSVPRAQSMSLPPQQPLPPNQLLGTFFNQSSIPRAPSALANTVPTHQLSVSASILSGAPAVPVATMPPNQGVSQRPPLARVGAVQNHINVNAPNLSTDWFDSKKAAVQAGGAMQVPYKAETPQTNNNFMGLSQIGSIPGGNSTTQISSLSASSTNSRDFDFASIQPAVVGSKALVPVVNGVSQNGAHLVSPMPQPAPAATSYNAPTVGAAAQPVNSYPAKPMQFDQLQNLASVTPGVGPIQQNQPLSTQAQTNVVNSTSFASVPNDRAVPASLKPTQVQLPWPKIMQSDVQKYTVVFIKVDRDRDGKITGEEARNLFLSWKLPREILKKVWDLSDQDNDGMLSFREFCVAVYLMERYRERRPLPDVLPPDIWSEGVSLPSTGQFSSNYSGPPSQQANAAFQGSHGQRHVMHAPSTKTPQHAHHSAASDENIHMQPQKPNIPVLEKNLLDQLSNEEQSALNAKLKEAEDADKKVQELEKEIAESREKIEFFRTKMQELILYKSRCDNRLNEISERISAERQEVQSLSKKYGDKCKQVGDVASKLTMEEATFRDIQDKKLELYNAIVKVQKGDNSDEALQDQVNKVHLDLEELVKSLNEQCKRYGLRTKPSCLMELPFGWQPGIQEAARAWDDNWDSFGDDAGFTIIKDLTVEDESNVSTERGTPTPEPDKLVDNEASSVESAVKEDSKDEKPATPEKKLENDATHAHDQADLAKGISAIPGSPQDNHVDQHHNPTSGFLDNSPHARGIISDQDAIESSKSSDEHSHSWGPTFDNSEDTESTWDFNAKESDANSFLYGAEGLFPIKTSGSPRGASISWREQKPQFDSVPGTPMYNSFAADSPTAPGVYGMEQKVVLDSSIFYKSFGVDSPTGSVPGKEQRPFFDSVPSTPMYNSVFSPRYSEAGDDRSFDSFSQYDSFGAADNSPFSQQNTFSRFDSFRSTSGQDTGDSFMQPDTFSRFDSFRSNAGQDSSDTFNTFSRFDSFRSISGQDAPDNFNSFSRFDSFNSSSDQDTGDKFMRFDSIRSNADYGQPDKFSRFDSFNSTSGFGDSFGGGATGFGNKTFGGFDSTPTAAAADRNRAFSFDDDEPFGAGPTKPSESHGSGQGKDKWSAF